MHRNRTGTISTWLGQYASNSASPRNLSLLPTPFEDSERATQIFNKGRIQVGYDADLVLVDMNHSKTIRNEDHLTRTRWSGQTLKGWPVRILVHSDTVFRHVNADVAKDSAVVKCDHKLGGSRPRE